MNESTPSEGWAMTPENIIASFYNWATDQEKDYPRLNTIEARIEIEKLVATAKQEQKKLDQIAYLTGQDEVSKARHQERQEIAKWAKNNKQGDGESGVWWIDFDNLLKELEEK